VTSKEESRLTWWTSHSCGKDHVRRRRPNTPTGTSPDESTPDQVYPYGCNNLGSRPISVNAILWRQQKTHDWLGERERTETARNVTISFSLTFKARQSPGRATATLLNAIIRVLVKTAKLLGPTEEQWRLWLTCSSYNAHVWRALRLITLHAVNALNVRYAS
jgi:hypothetical protein